MAAWPRNVVKEHRAAAWVLYVFLLSLFITYASYTINHNLQRRDEPVVVEDVVEEAWTLPDIVVCLIYTDGLFELGRYQCLDSNTNEDDCSATAYVSSNVTALEDPKFCVHFETSTLGQRSRGDQTVLEFTWKEHDPFKLVDWNPDWSQLREAAVFLRGGGGDMREYLRNVFYKGDSFNTDDEIYYIPISTAADEVGYSTDMSPEKEVHRRLGHPYKLPPPPTQDEASFRATFTTSPLVNYQGDDSNTPFESCYGSDELGGSAFSVPDAYGCPGQPVPWLADYQRVKPEYVTVGYFQLYVDIHSLKTRYYIEQDPMEPLKLWGILAGTFTQVGMLFGLCFIGKAHLRARFSGKAAEAVGERSSRLGARLSSTPAVTRLRTRSASLGARLTRSFPGPKASRSEDSDADASAAVELGEVTNPVSSPEPLGRGEPEGIGVLAPPEGLL